MTNDEELDHLLLRIRETALVLRRVVTEERQMEKRLPEHRKLVQKISWLVQEIIRNGKNVLGTAYE